MDPATNHTDAHEADTDGVRVVAGRYELKRVIGRGGVGVVYEAENTWTRRRVALKVLDAGRAADGAQVQRFMREARTAAALRHPHVVDVLDMGQDGADGSLYIVQELLVGEDLRAHLRREGRLGAARVRALAVPLLRGLAAAHAAGVVHRDIKPANLFLARGPDGDEVPKLIDFGVARELGPAHDAARTDTGTAVGTPAYMAPEQLRAERDIGPAADVWAMGVVLHEMLAGAHPFPAASYHVLVHRVLSGDRVALDPAVAADDPALRAAVDRALDPDPARRFPSAAAMLDALAAGAPSPGAAPPRPPEPRPRRALALGLAAVVVTGLVVALALNLRAPPPVRPPVTPATAAPPAAPPAAAPAVAAPETRPAAASDASLEAPAPVAAARARTRHAAPRTRATTAEPAAPAAPGPPAPSDPTAPRPRARQLTYGGAYPSE